MKKQLHKKFVRWGLSLTLLTGLVHLGSAALVDSRLQYKEVFYASERLPQELDGYTIVFLSDIHRYPDEDLAEMVQQISQYQPDLLLLGGDFYRHRDLDSCMEILARISPADGIYGVEGNHDNAAQLRAAMERKGMVLLENEGMHIRQGFYLAGLRDLYGRQANLNQALQGARQDDFILALAHNPDTTMELDFSRVSLTLSGHNHGGEITLFGQWAPAVYLTSDHGQRFVSGWCRSAAGTRVYVSNGIGRTTNYLPRVFARPQVIVLTLHNA